MTGDLAELDDAEAEAALDAQIDGEIAQGNAEMRRVGMSDEEIARARGIPQDQLRFPDQGPTLGTVEAELRQIEQRRREDRRAYFKDEAMQQRERELLATKEKLKTSRASEEPADAERADDLRAITDELREIDKLRRTDGRAYRRDEALQARERELLEAKQQAELAADGADDLPDALKERWIENGGVKANLEAARSRVILALGDSLESEDVQSLMDSFDSELPDEVRVEVADQLTTDHNWPAARPAEVQEFQATAWGAELSQIWGGRTARMLGAARREAFAIEARLGERQRLTLNNWVNAKTSAQRRRMVELLAARATRRL